MSAHTADGVGFKAWKAMVEMAASCMSSAAGATDPHLQSMERDALPQHLPCVRLTAATNLTH
jgi:hypothetical protein